MGVRRSLSRESTKGSLGNTNTKGRDGEGKQEVGARKQEVLRNVRDGIRVR